MSRSWCEEQSKWNKSSQIFFFFFFPFSLSLRWHFQNIKQKQRLESQSCDALVAVRGWLLHADQGKVTSNDFKRPRCRSSVCWLRHPGKESALDTRSLMRAQNGCLAKKKTNPQRRINGQPAHARCLLFSRAHEWARPRAHTYELNRAPSPRDEECLIRTPRSSKPVTFHCRSKWIKRKTFFFFFFPWKMQQICDELWRLKPIWSHAPLWHLWGSAHHTFRQSLTTSDEASPLLVLLSTRAKYELFKAEHCRLLGPRGRRHASFSSD